VPTGQRGKEMNLLAEMCRTIKAMRHELRKDVAQVTVDTMRVVTWSDCYTKHVFGQSKEDYAELVKVLRQQDEDYDYEDYCMREYAARVNSEW
jgi:hypothetical protein